jgi:hypothetical protein
MKPSYSIVFVCLLAPLLAHADSEQRDSAEPLTELIKKRSTLDGAQKPMKYEFTIRTTVNPVFEQEAHFNFSIQANPATSGVASFTLTPKSFTVSGHGGANGPTTRDVPVQPLSIEDKDGFASISAIDPATNKETSAPKELLGVANFAIGLINVHVGLSPDGLITLDSFSRKLILGTGQPFPGTAGGVIAVELGQQNTYITSSGEVKTMPDIRPIPEPNAKRVFDEPGFIGGLYFDQADGWLDRVDLVRTITTPIEVHVVEITLVRIHE